MKFLHWFVGLFRRKSKRWKLKPVPRMRSTYSLALVEKACALLDLDADLVISGDLRLEDVKAPPIAKAQLFLELILENGDQFRVMDWTPQQFQAIMAALVANFFLHVMWS